MTEDSAGVITVTCGNLVGKLHMEKFICPGIHRECIEFEGRFISPKLFSVMGEKEKLKDWKNAVRMNGIQLRKYIESGQLDFTNHQEMCTGRCVPRAPLKTMVFDDGTLAPISTLLAGTGISIKENSYFYDSEQTSFKTAEAVGSQYTYVNQSHNQDDPDVKPSVQVLHRAVTAENTEEQQQQQQPDESQLFWKGIIELGLADEIFREIKTTLDNLKYNLIRNQCPLEEVRKVSRVVSELGLTSKLKYRLAAHKTDMERQKDKLDKEMEELRRRVAEAEHKKELLKRKSQCFDHLLEISKSKRQGLLADSSSLYMHSTSPSPDSSQLTDHETMNSVHVKTLCASSSSSSANSSGHFTMHPAILDGTSNNKSMSRTRSPVSVEEARSTS
ncbi:glucocorticoid modulatory element-binding protein 2 isoform X2 [Octopus bimaculoides]|uniref:glucocorticoid modulatory element-binding protein 2 isoform X2 n=1 Tax=Octopus bimaculoides TaxID=37653 RepID=UPI00071CF3CF|nr:glucocorticoid modulatory element-binding protein 2 isoform X2 [Octopus bimaculoides]|eukprot:XP_014770920.1 PREDICTED: glucocorticoid modulatory element-binding protein 2-like isoform X2 [Octopus bimaculoides]